MEKLHSGDEMSDLKIGGFMGNLNKKVIFYPFEEEYLPYPNQVSDCLSCEHTAFQQNVVDDSFNESFSLKDFRSGNLLAYDYRTENVIDGNVGRSNFVNIGFPEICIGVNNCVNEITKTKFGPDNTELNPKL